MMPSGWTRWLFEQFEFPFEIVYPTTLDAGNLRSKFDVLVFADGAMRRGAVGRGAGGGRGGAVDPESVPEEYRASIGRITEEKTMPEIKKFVESGGDHRDRRQFHYDGRTAGGPRDEPSRQLAAR